MSAPPDRRRQVERAAGIGLAALGVAVLILALFALRNPNGRGAKAVKSTTTATATTTATTKPSATTTATPKPSATSGAPSTPANTSTSAIAPTNSGPGGTSAAPGKLPLVVLNNTLVAKLADQAKARFEAGGWTVSSTGNLTNDIASTCAYFDPAAPGAESAARALQAQYPTIKRVAPKFAELPPGPVVVVLTPDYSPN